MIGFREALEKARKKSMYAIGKHPNSHRKGPGTEEPSSSLSDTQRIFLENLRYNNGGRFRIPTAKWAVKTGHATYDFESDKYKITQKGLDATKPKAPTDHANKVAMDHVSAPYHPKANAARRQAMKDLIAHQSDPRERGIGVDLDTGERLYDTMGTAGKGYEWDADFERPHVPMHEAITAREKNKSRRTLESHTHPKSRMGFSEGDWGVLMGTSEMHEMRVVSNDRIFAATKTKAFFKLPYSMRTPRQARKRQEELVEEEFQSNKHATVEDMVDAANRRMGKEFGIKYREVRRPKGTISKSFDDIMKARAKSQYAIGKHPNSHTRRGVSAKKAPKARVRTGVVQDGDSIRSKAIEHGFAYDRQGKVILQRSGTVNKIEFPVEDYKTLFGSKLMLHNHPNGTSFSGNDINFAMSLGIRRMRVVGKTVDGEPVTYDMDTGTLYDKNVRQLIKADPNDERMQLRGSLYEGSKADLGRYIDDSWSSMEGKWLGRIVQRIKRSGMTPKDANIATDFERSHGILLAFAKKHGIRYTRKVGKGANAKVTGYHPQKRLNDGTVSFTSGLELVTKVEYPPLPPKLVLDDKLPKRTVSKSFDEIMKVSDKAKRRLMQFSTQRLNRRRALARGNKSAAASLAGVSRAVAKSFNDIYKFNEALHPRDEDGQFTNKLSDGDVGELKGYSTSGGSYDRVNSGLRSGKDMSADPTVAALDRAFAAQAENAPATLYRGLAGWEIEELDLTVGKEFVDPAFVSTTSEKKSAVKFATHGNMKLSEEGVGIIFKINTKKSPSLDMNRFSNYEEQETLLNRGTRFKVTGIKPGEAGRTLAQVTLTVVPN